MPHATAGVVILEVGAGSDDDLLDALDRLLPREDRWYRHRHGSPGHGADHVLPLLAAPSVTVPVVGGQAALGTWQSICLLDPNADNATRTVRLSFLRRLTAPPGVLGASAHHALAARTDHGGVRMLAFPQVGAILAANPADPVRTCAPGSCAQVTSQAALVARPPADTPERAGGNTRCRCVPIPRTSR